MFLRLDRRRGEGGRPAGWRRQDLVGNIGEAGKSIIKDENVMESNRVGRKKQAWIFSKKEVNTCSLQYTVGPLVLEYPLVYVLYHPHSV